MGFLNVAKPPGPTSHDIVAAVRRRLPRRTRVGHAGTLDPFAEGVLVVCVGPATRLAHHVQQSPKAYRATVRLGAVSTTDDTEGEITELAIDRTEAGPARNDESAPTPPTGLPRGSVEGAHPNLAAVRAALARFVGEIKQTPPAYSAVHVNGRRAYKLARAGQAVALAARTVTVHAIELIGYEWPWLEIAVRCGSGTYIRALARDIGAALGVGGYCRRLTRTAVGPFRLDDAAGPADIDIERHLIDPLVALEHLPRFAPDENQEFYLRNGNAVDIANPPPPGEVAVVDRLGRLIALARIEPGNPRLYPRRVFVQ